MGGLTFQKRQKEMKRKEKRQTKEDKRAARKRLKIDPAQALPDVETNGENRAS